MIKFEIEKIEFQKEKEIVLLDDENEKFPQLADRLINSNILEYFIPDHLEGKMGSIEQTLLIGHLISRRDLTSAIAIGQTLLGSLPVWLYGNEEQKKDLAKILKTKGLSCLALTEKENGSDLQSTLVKDNSNKISGEKWCINNATKSKALTVLTINNQGLFNLHFIQKEKAHQGSYEYTAKLKTLGIKGADISGIKFSDFQQENSLVGKEGKGLEIILKTMQISRLLCASFSLGASDSMLRMALNFAKSRILYGDSILKLSAVQKKLNESILKYQLIESFSNTCARLITKAPECMSLYSAISKFYTTKLADEIIKDCSEILGARFYLRESEYGMAQKIVRDHRVVSLFDGNSDVNISIIANQIKRLSKIHPLDIDPEIIFKLNNSAPSFTGEEPFKLTSRGRDIIWETLNHYDFKNENKEYRKKLIEKRNYLFTRICLVSNNDSIEMIELVHEYVNITFKANLFLINYFNNFSTLTIDDFYQKLEQNKLFSIKDISLN